jgi:hypothetical protein
MIFHARYRFERAVTGADWCRKWRGYRGGRAVELARYEQFAREVVAGELLLTATFPVVSGETTATRCHGGRRGSSSGDKISQLPLSVRRTAKQLGSASMAIIGIYATHHGWATTCHAWHANSPWVGHRVLFYFYSLFLLII